MVIDFNKAKLDKDRLILQRVLLKYATWLVRTGNKDNFFSYEHFITEVYEA